MPGEEGGPQIPAKPREGVKLPTGVDRLIGLVDQAKKQGEKKGKLGAITYDCSKDDICILTFPNGASIEAHDDAGRRWFQGLPHTVARVNAPQQPGKPVPPPPWTLIFDRISFSATDKTCSDLLWIQYVKYKDTFFDGSTEVVTSDPSPRIDTVPPMSGIPYPAQGDVAGATTMSDQPGALTDAGTNAEVAAAEVKQLGSTEAPGKPVTKVVRLVSFWTYLICNQPHQVVGHYAWSFVVTYDVNDAADPIKVSDFKDPAWTADK